jgi:hypothetical protein
MDTNNSKSVTDASVAPALQYLDNTPTEQAKRKKKNDYLIANGLEPIKEPTEEERASVVASLIDESKLLFKKIEYAMKKRYAADYKAYRKRYDDLMQNLVDHTLPNSRVVELLFALNKEIREHPVYADVNASESELKTKLQAFGEHHTIAMYGGKVCIRREEKHDWVLPEQLAKFYSNVDVTGIDGKLHNIVYAFMDSDESRRYGEVAFDPANPGHHGDVYNLWQGWSVEPEAGDEDEPWWDVLRAACGYNADYVDYVTKWFADIFQNPTRKPGTAIGISGRQGIGKSALVETIGMLMSTINQGGHSKTISGAYGDFSMDELLADYNEHVANKLLVYLDEATWGGSHIEQQRMKKIITKQFENINPKFLGKITLPCYRREVFSSNNEFYYRPDKDDRRLLPLEFDTSKINDKTYDFWKWFYASRSTGKMLANLLYNLQHVDLTDWEPQEALKSLRITTGQSMLDHSKEPWEHWLWEIAEAGSIVVERKDSDNRPFEDAVKIEDEILADSLFQDAFLLWARKNRVNGNGANWYGKKFQEERKLVLGQTAQKMEKGDRFYYRRAPTCEDMVKRLKEGQRWGQ